MRKVFLELSTRSSGRRFRRAMAWGMVASVAIHVAAFLLWRSERFPFLAGGPPAGQAAEPVASNAMQAFHVSLPRAEEIPAPPRPVVAPDLPRIEEPEAEHGSAMATVDMRLPAGAGGREAGEESSGRGPAVGAGEGAETPVPRSLFPQWDPPSSVRGMRVTVHVHVDELGHPTEVRLDPPTPDRGFNRHLVEQVRRMEYRPARRAGEPVAGWTEITFVF